MNDPPQRTTIIGPLANLIAVHYDLLNESSRSNLVRLALAEGTKSHPIVGDIDFSGAVNVAVDNTLAVFLFPPPKAKIASQLSAAERLQLLAKLLIHFRDKDTDFDRKRQGDWFAAFLEQSDRMRRIYISHATADEGHAERLKETLQSALDRDPAGKISVSTAKDNGYPILVDRFPLAGTHLILKSKDSNADVRFMEEFATIQALMEWETSMNVPYVRSKDSLPIILSSLTTEPKASDLPDWHQVLLDDFSMQEGALDSLLEEIIHRLKKRQDFEQEIGSLNSLFANSIPPYELKPLARFKPHKPSVPGISAPLPRQETKAIEEQLAHGRAVLVTGEPGTGKSGLAFSLYRSFGPPTLFLDARAYSNVDSLLGLAHQLGVDLPVLQYIEQVSKKDGCRLIIDHLDSAAIGKSGNMFTDLAIQSATLTDVQVVVFSRGREGYELKGLGKLIEANFVELPCGNLPDQQVRQTLQALGFIEPSNKLVELSRNILNLSLIARIREKNPKYEITSIADELELWESFIDALQDSENRHGNEGPFFGEQIVNEAIRIACEGMITKDRLVRLKSLELSHRRLLSWQIIIKQSGYDYRFIHDKLQDYLYARERVADGYMPGQVIAEIGRFRTYTILPWMSQLYRRNDPAQGRRFLMETLNVRSS